MTHAVSRKQITTLLFTIIFMALFSFSAWANSSGYFEDFSSGGTLSELDFSETSYWKSEDRSMKSTSPAGGNELSETLSPLFSAPGTVRVS